MCKTTNVNRETSIYFVYRQAAHGKCTSLWNKQLLSVIIRLLPFIYEHIISKYCTTVIFGNKIRNPIPSRLSTWASLFMIRLQHEIIVQSWSSVRRINTEERRSSKSVYKYMFSKKLHPHPIVCYQLGESWGGVGQH